MDKRHFQVMIEGAPVDFLSNETATILKNVSQVWLSGHAHRIINKIAATF